MHKITILTVLTALALTGAASGTHAQETNPATVRDTAVINRVEPAAQPVEQAVDMSTIDTLELFDASELEPHKLTPNEKRRERGLMDARNLFVPRGQWVFGGTASYSTHTNESYRFFIVEGIDSKGYTFRVSPLVAYAIRNNMAIGGRFVYSRTLLKLDNAHLKIGEEDSGIDITAKDFYSLKHSYTFALIWRQYIPLGNSKRFALFNEMQLGAGGTQAKFANDSPVKGTYETGYTLSLGISPGIVAFATNNMAIEVNVGVMGITYNNTKQVHNQVTVGRRKSSMMNFKVNIFTIGLGMAFYL